MGADGQALWSQQYRATRQEVPFALAVSALGEVCVAARGPGSNGLADFVTLKYTREGAFAWERNFGSTNELSAEQPRAVAFDEDGSIYVTGGGTPGFVTLKYASDGTLLWTAIYQPANTGEQYAGRMVIDRDRNVIVAGTVNHSTERLNWGIVKYGPTGTEIWARQYNHPTGSDDGIAGIAIDNEGSIYVAGARGTNYLGLSILVTAKYSADGIELWRTEYAAANPPRDLPVNLAVDSSGAVYVLAESWRTNSDPDYLVLKYEQARATPRFVDIHRSPDALNMSIFSRAGATCRVDVSENLRDWMPLTSFLNATGTVQLSDPASHSSGQRFYRVESIVP
jgi:outer membrane protein assembly factor BamB